MADVGIKELLEAGVHFGHQTRRWNPRMRRFIYGEREGIHIIDLLQTEELLRSATQFVTEVAAKGGVILFVGTKKQARDSIQEWAERCGMPYVNRRWLGGLLTNFNTIRKRIQRLHELRELKEGGRLDLLPTKERMSMEAELRKLEYNLGGVADMQRLPDAVIITDLKTEEIALREAQRLELPIIGLVDTNCDPTAVDYVIQGNDDAIRSCELIIGTLGSAIEGAAAKWREEEARRRAEEEERKRREEEERQRREGEIDHPHARRVRSLPLCIALLLVFLDPVPEPRIVLAFLGLFLRLSICVTVGRFFFLLSLVSCLLASIRVESSG